MTHLLLNTRTRNFIGAALVVAMALPAMANPPETIPRGQGSQGAACSSRSWLAPACANAWKAACALLLFGGDPLASSAMAAPARVALDACPAPVAPAFELACPITPWSLTEPDPVALALPLPRNSHGQRVTSQHLQIHASGAFASAESESLDPCLLTAIELKASTTWPEGGTQGFLRLLDERGAPCFQGTVQVMEVLAFSDKGFIERVRLTGTDLDGHGHRFTCTLHKGREHDRLDLGTDHGELTLSAHLSKRIGVHQASRVAPADAPPTANE